MFADGLRLKAVLRQSVRFHLLHDADQIAALHGDPGSSGVGDVEARPTESGSLSSDDGIADRSVRTAVLVGASLMLAAVALDSTIISVALPTIRNDLGGGARAIQWIASVYFLAAAVVLVPAGRMVDLVGARRVIVSGGVVYFVGSLLGAVSVDSPVLIAARFTQGVGSGIISPAAIVLVTGVFGARRRGIAIGFIGTILAGASALGPVVGGALTDTVGWRAIFVIHAVMACLGAGLALRAPKLSRYGRRRSMDGWGILTWAALILSFQMAVLHWGSVGLIAGVALLGVSCLFGIALYWIERGRDEPLMDLSLLKIPAVAASATARTVVSFAFFGSLYYFTLFLQSDAGYSAFQTGLILLPSSIVGVMVSPAIGKLIDRVGSRMMLGLGTAIAAFGLFLLAVVNETSSVVLHVMPALALNGLGYAMVSVSAKAAPLDAVATDLRGRVTSLVSVVSKAASGFGVTVATGFFNVFATSGINNGMTDYSLSASDTTRSFIRANLGSSDLRGSVTANDATAAGFTGVDQAVDVIGDRFAFSMSLTFARLGLVVIAGAGVIVMLLRKSHPPKKSVG